MEHPRTSNRATMPPSRLGGAPATVPPADESARGQLFLPIGEGGTAGESRASVHRREPLPAAVHVRGWLGIEAQRDLVRSFRLWALPPAGLRQPRVPSGHLMSVRSVCLGWHWQPYVYSKTADDTDGAPVKALPRELAELAREAVAETYGAQSAAAAGFAPDAAIVNLYEPDARLGLHRDAEEPSPAPVVTISLATRACSASRESSGGPVPSRTWSFARATFWCSAGRSGGSTTASPRSCPAPLPPASDFHRDG